VGPDFPSYSHKYRKSTRVSSIEIYMIDLILVSDGNTLYCSRLIISY
jgi:hypothetical protein